MHPSPTADGAGAAGPSPLTGPAGGTPTSPSTVAIVALVAANLVPLVGVALRGWSLHSMLILYWVESGIIGVLNVGRIAMAQGPEDPRSTITINGRPQQAPKALLVPFFCFHYGLFWVVHGVFVFALPTFAGLGSLLVDRTADPGRAMAVDFGRVEPRTILLSGACLLASHVLSFVVNWWLGGEYRTVSPSSQMLAVYGRVVVLHVTILGGALLVGFFGTPLAALVLLVAGKTALDLVFHLREHRRARRAVVPAG